MKKTGGYKLISGPAVEPLVLTSDPPAAFDVKSHLRVDGGEEDALITALISAARQHAESETGRVLITQTWELALPEFPPAAIDIGLGPVQSITSIKYLDSAQVEQTLSASLYSLDTYGLPAQAAPAYNTVWPVTLESVNAVKLRFVAGYGDNGAAVPAPIKQAMLLLIGHWYENRESVMVGAPVAELPMAVQALLNPYRIINH